jgi:major vault protein
MSEEDTRGGRRERDMILAPNEYAFISDETKGEVNAFVGPNKQSLAGTDRCVTFDLKTKRFRPTDFATGIQTFQTAPEGWYIVLKNPAENDKHPSGNGKLSTPNLRVGKKINISGPASFALWPGQMAKVVQGHSLRSNEYLLCRVYDEEAARANWSKAVIKTQTDAVTTTTESESPTAAKSRKAASEQRTSSDIPTEKDLSMGKLFVVRGTEVSFYIPPTGIEVVTEGDKYVREAVSLERLEYCLLLDQDGNKRYVRGPAVVFPKPTEKFVDAAIKSNPDKARAKKFRAQELTPTSGIHIRVIAAYTEEDGTERKAGEELFITGATDPVYFPREEHAIIKYGEQDVHFGIAIPAGEARYVLNRLTGEVTIIQGPKIFLPDPRSQVIAQRALPLNLCSLIYPGNDIALAINAERLGVEDQDYLGAAGANAAFLNSNYVRSETENEAYAAVAAVATPEGARRGFMIKGSSKALPGDAFDRKSKFTAPRSVILNTKYDGAVTVKPYTNFAMLLVRGNDRRLVQGPGTFMLEYDEVPQVMTLSTGKPKTMDKPFQTVYLQVKNNVVSDIVEVETKDYCRLNVKLSYRVNFEGDSSLWFNVDNYVKFLCDHMRSKLRNAVQKLNIEDFYSNHTEILRDIILGKSTGDGKPRAGTTFAENGMRIYDVEVLGVQMQNSDVEKMLVAQQREVIQNTLILAGERRKLAYIQESEEIKRQVAETNAETSRQKMLLEAEAARRQLELDLTRIETASKSEQERIAKASESAAAQAALQLANEKAQAEQTAVQLQVQQATDAQRLEQAKANQALELAKLEAQVTALVEKAKAVSPDLIAALNSFGERAMVEKVSEAMAPLSILGGGSVVDVLKKLLEGTALAKQLEPAMNGSATTTTGLSAKPRSRSASNND